MSLFEAHLTVADLERSIAFYRDRLGFTLAHIVPARGVAFLWLGAPGETMLGLWSIGSAPVSIRSHIAFRVGADEIAATIPKLRTAGIAPRDPEPVVHCWMPAASVYFDDPDGHSLEYIAMLPDPPRPDLAGRVTLAAWRDLQTAR